MQEDEGWWCGGWLVQFTLNRNQKKMKGGVRRENIKHMCHLSRNKHVSQWKIFNMSIQG